MGNIFSIFNSIYNDNCIFCRNKKNNTSKSPQPAMCVITPLSPDYDIQIITSTTNRVANCINTTPLVTEKQNIKV